jgi:hypothetical protein
MRSAKDFRAGRAAQLRTHHAVEGLGVRSARSLFEPGEGLEEHERGGGGHFSPRLEGSSASQAPQLHSFAGFFFGQKPHGRSRQAGSLGEDLRSHGFDLRRYGGEGKTASSGLRDPSRRGPNPFPGPLFALSTQRRIVPRQILAKSRVGLRCETAQQRFLEEFPRACGLAIPATPTFAAQLEIETPARPDLPGRASTLSFRRTAG